MELRKAAYPLICCTCRLNLHFLSEIVALDPTSEVNSISFPKDKTHDNIKQFFIFHYDSIVSC